MGEVGQALLQAAQVINQAFTTQRELELRARQVASQISLAEQNLQLQRLRMEEERKLDEAREARAQAAERRAEAGERRAESAELRAGEAHQLRLGAAQIKESFTELDREIRQARLENIRARTKSISERGTTGGTGLGAEGLLDIRSTAGRRRISNLIELTPNNALSEEVFTAAGRQDLYKEFGGMDPKEVMKSLMAERLAINVERQRSAALGMRSNRLAAMEAEANKKSDYLKFVSEVQNDALFGEDRYGVRRRVDRLSVPFAKTPEEADKYLEALDAQAALLVDEGSTPVALYKALVRPEQFRTGNDTKLQERLMAAASVADDTLIPGIAGEVMDLLEPPKDVADFKRILNDLQRYAETVDPEITAEQLAPLATELARSYGFLQDSEK